MNRKTISSSIKAASDALHYATIEFQKLQKCRTLIKDCQTDLAKYLVPDSGITEKEIISQLLERLDGPQAREALDEQR